ncbi:MAG TPA: hypothetical protein VGO11_05785 [Chthoniobacteraceae bacterium]|nr:hypothetical protein [Chthoniobacteraceae bacterium]
MNINDALLLIAPSAAISSLLTVGLTFLTKTWWTERIRGSIRHEYDQLLENYKAQLKEESDQKLETLKAQLKGASDVQIEQLKTQLAIAANERNVRSSRSITRLLEVSEKTYELLMEAHNSISFSAEVLSNIGASEWNTYRDSVSQRCDAFTKYFYTQRIYFAGPLAVCLQKASILFNDAANQIIEAVDSRDVRRLKELIPFGEHFKKDTTPLFREVEHRIRISLGLEFVDAMQTD